MKVIKRDKSTEAFKLSKIIRSCKRAGCPESIAKAIASDVKKKLGKKKTVASSSIKKIIFEILMKCIKAKKGWPAYERMKRKKKDAKKKKAVKRKSKRKR